MSDHECLEIRWKTASPSNINLFEKLCQAFDVGTDLIKTLQSVYFTLILLVASLSGIFVGRATRISYRQAIDKWTLRFILGDYSSPYSTLPTKVNSTSLCYRQNFLILLGKSLFFTHFPASMKIMFSLRSSSYDLDFLATTFYHSVNLKQLPMVLTAFPSFQQNSGMHCLTFFLTSCFADFKSKIQVVSLKSILFPFIYLYLKL